MPTYEFRSQATLACLQDFTLSLAGPDTGSSVQRARRAKITCSADGAWKARLMMRKSQYHSFVPLNMLSCRPVECPQPDAITLGTVYITINMYFISL